MTKKISIKFIRGVGSVMALYPLKKYPIKSYRANISSADRLKSDWMMVGKTISKVMATQSNGKR